MGGVVIREGSFRQRPVAPRATVERRIEAMELEEPRLQVSAEQGHVGPVAGGGQHGQREAVDGVLGFPFLRERVEQLREVGQRHRRVQPAPDGTADAPHHPDSRYPRPRR